MMSLLLTIVVAFFASGLITTFLGYWVHWIFHQPWSLGFYHAHMNHHQIQYPPSDYLSDTYRGAGRDSTVILFVVAFAPVLIGIALLTWFGFFTLTTCGIIVASLAIWGYVHDYFHDQFHLNNTWWKQFSFFIKLRSTHYLHHLDMSKNYGIILFPWDKLFNTYDAENITLDKENDAL
jgi:sterol desaturase/sphingolipid hydroxylase (fatty acid hydroxylase superfamily)